MGNITNKELQRMKALMGIKKPINESNILSSTELIKEAPNGKFYGIVRENKKYFIKESNDGVNFDFIGGLVNKTKNQFESYEQAVRRLNLMLEDTNVLTPDIISEKKFVIKTKKKKKKAETEDEGGFGDDETTSTDEGDDFDFGDETGEGEDTSNKEDEKSTEEEGGDDFDFGDEEESTDEEGGDDFDFGDEEGGDEEESTDEEGGDDFDFGDEEESTEEESDEDLDLEDDPIKSIQKMTGKLGQKIRDTEDLSSDTMKWVAKSVISALDLDQMDSEDKKDIIRAIKKKESEGSDEEFDFMADWSSMSSHEKNELVNGDSMYGPQTNVGRGEEIIIDDDNESHCSYCGDNSSMPYDDEGDEYPGMGSDWRRPMSYMSDYNRTTRKNIAGKRLEYGDILNYVKKIKEKFQSSEIDGEEIKDTYGSVKTSYGTIKISDKGFTVKGENFGFGDLKKATDYLKGKESKDYMGDPYMMPQPAPARPQTRPETPVKPAKPGTDRPSPSKRPFTPPPHINPNDPDVNPNPKAEHECTHCNGYGYDDMTGEECEWCMGTGYEEMTYQYNRPTDRYYDNVQDYGTSQVMDYMEEPKYYGTWDEKDWYDPMDFVYSKIEGPDYEYDEFEYPDYESFRSSEFGKDPKNKWFPKAKESKEWFDKYRKEFGPLKIRKRKPHNYDETSEIFGQLDHMEDFDLGPKIHGRPSNNRITHRGNISKTYLSNTQKSNRAAKEQARLDMGRYFGDMNKDKSPTDEWRKHQLPYDTKFDTDFMEDGDMEVCNACEGKGREMHRIGFSRRESTCPICDGAGYVPRTEAGGEVDEPYVDDSNPIGYKSSSTLPSKVGYNVQYKEKFNFPFNMGENKKRRKSLTEDHINDKMATYDQEMAYEDIEDMAKQNGMEVEFCHKDRSKDPEEQTVYLDLMKNGKAVAKVRINSVGQIEMGHMTGKVFKGEPVDSYPDFDEVLREKRIKMSPQPAPTRREREAPTREKEKEKERERKTPPSRKPFTPPPHINPNDPDVNPNPKADLDSKDFRMLRNKKRTDYMGKTKKLERPQSIRPAMKKPPIRTPKPGDDYRNQLKKPKF